MIAKNAKTILIIDDSENDQLLLSKLVEHAGFASRAMWSGHEALQCLRSEPVEAVLVDDYLPDLHLSDFLNRLRRLPSKPYIVVMQDHSPSKVDRRRYEGLGVGFVANKRTPAAIEHAICAACVQKAEIPRRSSTGKATSRGWRIP